MVLLQKNQYQYTLIMFFLQSLILIQLILATYLLVLINLLCQGFKNTLDGDMSIVFHQNTVSYIESQITVSNDNFIVFQTDVLYENHTGTIQN